jgi:hypothetical protein
MGSLTPEFKALVLLHKANYYIANAAGTAKANDGPSLLKTIIQLTYIDTRATTAHIRDTLVSADIQLQNLKGNIEEFNNWVRGQVARLNARGEECADLLTYLFKAYTAAPDQVFKDYIRDRKDEYEDDRVNMTAEELMWLAENKYKNRQQNNTWAQASEDHTDIVALQATVNSLSKALKEKRDNKKNKTPGKTPGKKQPKGPKKQDFAWKNVPPKQGEGNTKTIKGKTYNFCPNHNQGNGKWVLHKLSECKGGSFKPKDKKEPKREQGEEETNLEQAMQIVLDSFSEDETEEE